MPFHSSFLGRLSLAMLLSLGVGDLTLPGSQGLSLGMPVAMAQEVPSSVPTNAVPSPAAAFSASGTATVLAPSADPAASLMTPAAPGAASDADQVPAAADAGLTPLPSLTTATPVVLELFTAEGCASCLPADANTGAWANRRSVLVLTYHVDYWDYIGWRDGKADPSFAERQQHYMTAFGRNIVYTPQLIIGGNEESLGTDRDRLAMALADSRHVANMVPVRWLRDVQGQVFVDLPAATLDKQATIWLITYRRSVETDILTGETAGKHLVSVNVVRSMRKLAAWSGGAVRLPVSIDRQAGGAVPADAAAIIANRDNTGGDGAGPVIAATAISFESLK